MISRNKILYVSPGLPIGGAEKFLGFLSNALVADTSKQILVSLSNNNGMQDQFDKNIDIIVLPFQYKFDIKSIYKLRKIVKAEKPQIIFCINFYSYFIIRCALIGLSTKAKRIISYHSTFHINKKEHFLHRLYTGLLNKKDLIITVSSKQAKYTAEHFGIPPRFFKTIYNGIDIKWWRLPDDDNSKTQIRSTYNIPMESKVIIIVAAFRPEKNHLGALNALYLLHTEFNCKAYLLLVGDGKTRELIKNKATELKLLEYIKFAGIQKDVRPFYWASDLFTLCSNKVETFSIAALEAMGCGLPCVLTDIGGAGEMIVEDFNGYLCRSDDPDIAKKWYQGLNKAFSKELIHNHVRSHFGSVKMFEDYKQILVSKS